jgi:hypothetical protein
MIFTIPIKKTPSSPIWDPVPISKSAAFCRYIFKNQEQTALNPDFLLKQGK